MLLRSCFELFEMFFEVKKLQTNNSKQLLRIAEKRSLKMQRLQFCRAKPPKGLVLTAELQRNYMCGALLGLPECKSMANKSKIAYKRLA